MWQQADYFQRIGITEPVRQRFQTCLDQFRSWVPEDEAPEFEIYIGNASGATRFGNLFFFTPGYRFMAADFITRSDFSLVPWATIRSLTCQYEDWSIGHPTDDSKMSVQFLTEFHIGMALGATGVNCTQLYSLFTEVLRPRMQPGLPLLPDADDTRDELG
jgi:hypothetical protein